MTLIQDLQRPYVGEVITLFQLDCTMLTSGSILYFTSTVESDGSEVVWNGQTYTPVEIAAEGFEYNGQGSFPTPTLQLSNVTNIASALVIANQDLIGAKLTRIRTLKTYLDDGDTPDPLQIFAPDIYVVEQKTKHDKRSIEWKLSAAVDQQGLQIPGHVLVRDFCSHTYRTYDVANAEFNYNRATCPYNDVAMFDVQNNSTADPTLDQCSKTLKGCRARFGVHGNLPFRGCPGLGRFR